MAEQFLFKDVFHRGNISRLAEGIKAEYSEFIVDDFVDQVMFGFEELSLSERSQRIAENLKTFLPEDFLEAIRVLRANFGEPAKLESPGHYDSFIYMPQAAFVAQYGMDFFEESMSFLYDLTRRFTSEFAIRPFLKNYPEKTLAKLAEWTSDDCPHVRRLVSEGSRPRLPWGMRLHQFIEDPQPVLELLSLLKDSPERYVEKSIANNLNDIAKDNPDLVIDTFMAWEKEGWRNDWLRKHALRTLFKEGNPRALALLGFTAQELKCSEIHLESDRINLGEALDFSFELSAKKKSKVMVDFIIHHVKANGQLSPKVFKLKQCEIEGSQSFKKKHWIKTITTRKYYSGMHRLEIQVNGKVLRTCEFYLNCK